MSSGDLPWWTDLQRLLQRGWQCPVCGSVHAPFVQSCAPCSMKMGNPEQYRCLKWAPLTEEQITNVYASSTMHALREQDKRLIVKFARGLEKAHGIGDSDD